jgi:hypothetical protein
MTVAELGPSDVVLFLVDDDQSRLTTPAPCTCAGMPPLTRGAEPE